MSDTDLVAALSEEVRCNICLELFEDPRVLDCLHTFCLGCISQIVKRSQGRAVVDCPLCRNVTFLGSNQVNGLKKNHYLANIAEKLKQTINKAAQDSSTPNNNNNSNVNRNPVPVPQQNNIRFPAPSAPPLYPDDPTPAQNPPPAGTSPYLQRHAPPINRNLSSTPPPQIPTQRNPPPPPPPQSSQPYFSTVTSFFSNLLYGTRAEPPQPPSEMPPEEFFYVPFSVPASDVANLFHQWAASLWLLPSDFNFHIPSTAVSAMYVPYWVYDVTVNSKCSAKVSRTDADPRDNGRAAAENWLNVDTSYMHVHPKLMICAAAGNTEAVAMGLVEQLDWKLDDTAVRRQPAPPLDIAVIRPQPHDVIWHEVAEKVIRNKEREKCEFDLKSQPLIANVKEVTLEINFLNVEHRLIYFPVYTASYTYGESTYKWVCNGISGNSQGNRPYGLGKLADYSKKGYDLVSGLIFNR